MLRLLLKGFMTALLAFLEFKASLTSSHQVLKSKARKTSVPFDSMIFLTGVREAARTVYMIST